MATGDVNKINGVLKADITSLSGVSDTNIDNVISVPWGGSTDLCDDIKNLPPPTSLSATDALNKTELQVTITWTEIDSGYLCLDYYEVYRSTTSGSYTVPLGTSNSDTYVDNTANWGTTYYYVVRSISTGDDKNSENSSETSVITMINPN